MKVAKPAEVGADEAEVEAPDAADAPDAPSAPEAGDARGAGPGKTSKGSSTPKR